MTDGEHVPGTDHHPAARAAWRIDAADGAPRESSVIEGVAILRVEYGSCILHAGPAASAEIEPLPNSRRLPGRPKQDGQHASRVKRGRIG